MRMRSIWLPFWQTVRRGVDDDAAIDDGSLSPDVKELEEELDLDALLDNQSEGDPDLSEEPVGLLIGEDEEEDNEEPILAEPFGLLSLEQPQENQDRHSKFRIAILGDFTGRANRGDLATGDDLANRKPIKLDVDNLDTIIARFATTLVLPLGSGWCWHRGEAERS